MIGAHPTNNKNHPICSYVSFHNAMNSIAVLSIKAMFTMCIDSGIDSDCAGWLKSMDCVVMISNSGLCVLADFIYYVQRF